MYAYLQSANQVVVDLVLEKGLALSTLTRPTPQVFALAAGFGLVQDGGADDPHDCAEDEEADGEHGVVSGSFLSALVAALAISCENTDGEDQ